MEEVKVLVSRQVTAVVAIATLGIVAIAAMLTGTDGGTVQACVAGIAGLSGLVIGESRTIRSSDSATKIGSAGPNGG